MPFFDVYYSVNPTLAISRPDGDHTGREIAISYLTAALDIKLNNNLFKTGKIGYQDQMVIRSLLSSVEKSSFHTDEKDTGREIAILYPTAGCCTW